MGAAEEDGQVGGRRADDLLAHDAVCLWLHRRPLSFEGDPSGAHCGAEHRGCGLVLRPGRLLCLPRPVRHAHPLHLAGRRADHQPPEGRRPHGRRQGHLRPPLCDRSVLREHLRASAPVRPHGQAGDGDRRGRQGGPAIRDPARLQPLLPGDRDHLSCAVPRHRRCQEARVQLVGQPQRHDPWRLRQPRRAQLLLPKLRAHELSAPPEPG